MFGFILSPVVKVVAIFAVVIALLATGYYKGYSHEKAKFDAFKEEVAAKAAEQTIKTTSINNNTMTTNTTKIESASSSTPLKIEVPVKLNEKVIASIAEEVYVTTNKNGGITLGRPKVYKNSEAVGTWG